MIIFYDKKTGDIVGNIEGRIHSDEHLRMWIGEDTERIVCQWVQGEDGEFHPEIPIFSEMENSRDIKNFAVDPITKTVIKVDSV